MLRSNPLTRLLALFAVLVLGFAGVGYAMGWIAVTDTESGTKIEIDKKSTAEDTKNAIDKARDVVEKASEAIQEAGNEAGNAVKEAGKEVEQKFDTQVDES